MKTTGTQYRYDLDGLRGISIALVVLFHVYVGRVSGGVDVFLLLSGFFFFGAQYRNAINPRQSINPWWSIWRTLRRLIPTLVLVLFATTLFVIYFIPSLRTIDIAQQLRASLLYYQNYELALQGSDYAAAESETSPLQHLWSMSVQGQFYLGSILLIFLLAWMTRSSRIVGTVTSPVEAKRTDATGGRLRRILTPLLTVITLGSLAYAFYMHSENQGWNYYSTVSRLWELCLGALLGLILVRGSIPMPKPLRVLLAGIGLALVVSTGFIFDGAAQFPGPWTLWPLGGAALIIIAGPEAGWISKFLASRPMREIGQSAYALYLWHWPLLILAINYLNRDTPGLKLGTAVIVVSFILAKLTNKYVELPLAQSTRRPTRTQPVVGDAIHAIKHRRPARRQAVVGTVVVIALVGMASLVNVQQVRVDRASATGLDPAVYPGALALTDGYKVPKAATKPNTDFITDLWPEPALDGCLATGGEDVGYFPPNRRWRDETQPCVYGDPDASESIVIIGGSHMEHWFAPIDAYGKNNGYRVVVLLRQGCPATLEPIHGVGDVCVAWTSEALQKIDEIQPEMVFTTSTRPLFQADPPQPGDYTPDGYVSFFAALQERGIDFFAIRDNPWALREDLSQFSPSVCEEAEEDCTIHRKTALNAENPAEEILANFPNGHSLDFSDIFCGPTTCRKVIGNIYVYRDSNHITDELAATFSPEMDRQIQRALRD